MMLDPGQLFALTEMGIPVWELRQQDVIAETEIKDTSKDIAFAPLPPVDCLIVVSEQDNHGSARRLLDAILFSIGLAPHNSAIVSSAQLAQINRSEIDHKLILAFGDDLVPKPIIVSAPSSSLNIITSISLTHLLSEPAKKALVWRDLQSAKASLQRGNIAS